MNGGKVNLRTVNVTRYITPLREGGSLPAIVEADDGFLYVIKFRGSGQGRKALIAELVGGEIARAVGFHVPELVLATLSSAFGRIEGDEEIQDLLKASVGLNVGVHYLSGAMTFDPLVTRIDATTASKLVWLDSLLMNVDRTYKNPNLLTWYRELWLIDHGAALYVHHSWNKRDYTNLSFPQIKDHILLASATEIAGVDRVLREILTAEMIREILNIVPDEWLEDEPSFGSVAAHRAAYAELLLSRLGNSSYFVTEAQDAREKTF